MTAHDLRDLIRAQAETAAWPGVVARLSGELVALFSREDLEHPIGLDGVLVELSPVPRVVGLRPGVEPSVAHAPPEWVAGLPLSPAGQVWVAASLTYALLMGRPAFSGSSPGAMRVRKLLTPPVAPPGPLGPAVMAGLSPEPARRPPSLEPTSGPTTAPAVPSPGGTARPRWGLWAGIAGVVLGVGALVWGAQLQLGSSDDRATVPAAVQADAAGSDEEVEEAADDDVIGAQPRGSGAGSRGPQRGKAEGRSPPAPAAAPSKKRTGRAPGPDDAAEAVGTVGDALGSAGGAGREMSSGAAPSPVAAEPSPVAAEPSPVVATEPSPVAAEPPSPDAAPPSPKASPGPGPGDPAPSLPVIAAVVVLGVGVILGLGWTWGRRRRRDAAGPANRGAPSAGTLVGGAGAPGEATGVWPAGPTLPEASSPAPDPLSGAPTRRTPRPGVPTGAGAELTSADLLDPVQPEGGFQPFQLSNYACSAELGEGGMGVVYLARHVHLDRPCAVKVLSPRAAGRAGALALFRREAQLAARVQHPNIVGIYDFGEAPGSTFFLAMELARGVTLGALPAPLPIRRILRITGQIAAGLDEAHQAGVLHRDLKPDNILVDEADDDRVKILDFGIARPLDQADGLVPDGVVMGTPAWMSPEQARGEADLTPASDVFSFALITYALFAGRAAWAAPGRTPLEVVLQRGQLSQPPPPVRAVRPGIPRAVDGILSRALSPDRAARHGVASAFYEEIAAVF